MIYLVASNPGFHHIKVIDVEDVAAVFYAVVILINYWHAYYLVPQVAGRRSRVICGNFAQCDGEVFATYLYRQVCFSTVYRESHRLPVPGVVVVHPVLLHQNGDAVAALAVNDHGFIVAVFIHGGFVNGEPVFLQQKVLVGAALLVKPGKILDSIPPASFLRNFFFDYNICRLLTSKSSILINCKSHIRFRKIIALVCQSPVDIYGDVCL